MPQISIIVPCFNEEESLPLFAKELDRVAREMSEEDERLTFELILVDDGSADGTLEVMRSLQGAPWKCFDVRWTSFTQFRQGSEHVGWAAYGTRRLRNHYGCRHARPSLVASKDAFNPQKQRSV